MGRLGLLAWPLLVGYATYVNWELISTTLPIGQIAWAIAGLLLVAAGLGALFLLVNKLKAKASASAVPGSMRAVMLVEHISKTVTSPADIRHCFEVRDVPTPVPRPGQVLIRVEASPVNPSDRSTLQGTYNRAQRSALPCQLGYEASGVVVKSGGGVIADMRVGQRVGLISKNAGTWSEYVVVPAVQCFPVGNDITFREASSMFVNPMTALAFIEIAQTRKAPAIVVTAAASALGRMVIRLAKSNNIAVVATLRTDKDRELLLNLGATEVVVTDGEGWEGRLREICRGIRASVAFDSVAGELTGKVLAAMPPRSTVYVYGGLSNQPCSAIRPTQLLFEGSDVRGFWLTSYLQRNKSMIGQYLWVREVVRLLKTDLRSEYGNDYPLDQLAEAVFNSNPDHGKSVICPQLLGQ